MNIIRNKLNFYSGGLSYPESIKQTKIIFYEIKEPFPGHCYLYGCNWL
jgi:hypothetical protein